MTCTDSAALAFYQENVDFVNCYGTSGMDRDERRAYNKGKAVAAALAESAKRSNRTPLSESELQPILAEYLRTYSDDGEKVKVFDRFAAAVSVSDHRDDRIATAMGIHGQIVACDQMNQAITKSFDRMGNTLKSLLADYNEIVGFARFSV